MGEPMGEEWVLPRIGTHEDPLRAAIMISGSGSGMEALIHHQQRTNCGHHTVIVISDKLSAGGLTKAQSLGVSSVVVELPDSENKRRIHEQEINQILQHQRVELIILSGYMRILTTEFVKPWAGRLLNIHPSLLPDFPGAHAHRDAIAAKATTSGCTVHFVDSAMDSGPILGQTEVPVYPDDDESSLGERVKIAEHKLYPQIIDRLARGDIQSPSNLQAN